MQQCPIAVFTTAFEQEEDAGELNNEEARSLPVLLYANLHYIFSVMILIILVRCWSSQHALTDIAYN